MERMKNQRHVKLSEDLRADIMNAKGQMSRSKAAAKFGVSSATVGNLWKGLEPVTESDQKVPEEARKKHARFTDLEKQGVVRAFQSGKAIPEIALMYGASDTAINRIILKETGIVRHARLNDKKKKDICRYYRLGWTFERIASELGIPVGTAASYIHKQGLANRNAKREDPELKMAPVRLDGTRDYIRKCLQSNPFKEDNPMNIEKSAIHIAKRTTLTGKYAEVEVCGTDVVAVTFLQNAEGDKSKFIEMGRELAAIADILEKGV